MAPTFFHSKNLDVLLGWKHVGRVLQDSAVNWTVDTADRTCYGDSDRIMLAGHRTGVATLSGLFDGSTSSTSGETAIVEAIAAIHGSTSKWPLTWGPLGTEGNPVRLANAIPTQSDVTAPVADVVKASLGATADGGPRSGVLLRTLAARSSTSSGTAIDFAAPSTFTDTMVGHLHVTAKTGTLTTVTIKVQHSSNASAWSDLISFSNVTGTTFGRSLSASSLRKRYVRATCSALTGGGTVTYAVAFGRELKPGA